MRKVWLACVLLLPLIVPLGLVIHHTARDGDIWLLPVAGYDPRDLLRGQYIQFRYDTHGVEKMACSNGDQCVLCLNGENQSPIMTIIDSPLAAEQCRSWVKIKNIEGQQRFYIPESMASNADALMQSQAEDIKALVSVKSGHISLKSLVIYDDTDIRDYLRDNEGRS